MNVEEDHVGSLAVDRCRRLHRITTLADDLHIGVIGEHGPQPLPGKRLVIYDQRVHRSLLGSPSLDPSDFQAIAVTWIRGVSTVRLVVEISCPDLVLCFGGT